MKNGSLISYALTPLLARQDVSLKAGSMMANPFPKLPNYFLDRLLIAPEISVAYGLSFPHFQVFGMEITAWALVFLLSGVIFGAFLPSSNQSNQKSDEQSRIIKYILPVYILCFLPDIKSFRYVALALLLTYVGFFALVKTKNFFTLR